MSAIVYSLGRVFDMNPIFELLMLTVTGAVSFILFCKLARVKELSDVMEYIKDRWETYRNARGTGRS